jgi:hypothetical protein
MSLGLVGRQTLQGHLRCQHGNTFAQPPLLNQSVGPFLLDVAQPQAHDRGTMACESVPRKRSVNLFARPESASTPSSNRFSSVHVV